MNQSLQRLRQLDFLRGLAILLVLLRHQQLFEFTSRIGWIGVDLFFVLSGFLVSRLLFKEYIKYGNIKPSRFLIRRGFKIYPIYYLFYPVYFLHIKEFKPFSIKAISPDILFIQNFVYGWGYANESSWSLAVEEHFYIGFSLLLWAGLSTKQIQFNSQKYIANLTLFEILLIVILLLCLLLRIITNLYFTNTLLEIAQSFTMTYLRIDSLLAGVLVSYLYTFKYAQLKKKFERHKPYWLACSLLLLLFVPFFNPVYSFFVKTIGFLFLYMSFSLLLIYFLLSEPINSQLNSLFTRPVVRIISKIGISSYSIYITHIFVIQSVNKLNIQNHYLVFFISVLISILVGMFFSTYVEDYFLKLRDKYYPARSV